MGSRPPFFKCYKDDRCTAGIVWAAENIRCVYSIKKLNFTSIFFTVGWTGCFYYRNRIWNFQLQRSLCLTAFQAKNTPVTWGHSWDILILCVAIRAHRFVSVCWSANNWSLTHWPWDTCASASSLAPRAHPCWEVMCPVTWNKCWVEFSADVRADPKFTDTFRPIRK